MVENVCKNNRKAESKNLDDLPMLSKAFESLFKNEDFDAENFLFLWSLWVSIPGAFAYGCYLVLQCEDKIEDMPHLREEVLASMMKALVKDFRNKPDWRSRYKNFYSDHCDMTVFDQVAAYPPEKEELFWETYDRIHGDDSKDDVQDYDDDVDGGDDDVVNDDEDDS